MRVVGACAVAVALFLLAAWSRELERQVGRLEGEVANLRLETDWLDKHGGEALRIHHWSPVGRAHPIQGNECACPVPTTPPLGTQERTEP